MVRRLAAVVVGAVALTVPAPAAAEPVPGQYIVEVKAGVDPLDVIADHKRAAKAEVLHTYQHALAGYSARLSTDGLRRVKSDPRVASVTQDQQGVTLQAPPPKKPPPPPPGPPAGGALPTGVNRIDADLRFNAFDDVTTVSDVGVGVFDTGIQVNHPDLNVVGGVNCVIGISNDGTYGDQYGHGTHVAGIAGAKDDRNGVVGVAPGARLWSVRVAGPGGLSNGSSQLCGIDWATANAALLGIDVMTASMALLGKPDDNNCGFTAGDVMHKAICLSTAAGVDWVFADGNNGAQYNNIAGASYNEVLAVSNLADSNGAGGGMGGAFKCSVPSGTVDDKYATTSNFASLSSDHMHTITAPGTCIQSTWLNSTWDYKTGTSMAAPHAAAAMALCIKSGQCAGTPAENIQKLRADAEAYTRANPTYGFTGDPLRPTTGRYYGFLVRAAGY